MSKHFNCVHFIALNLSFGTRLVFCILWMFLDSLSELMSIGGNVHRDSTVEQSLFGDGNGEKWKYYFS